MCTVSFVPYKKGFILTANRDEFSDRSRADFPNFVETKRGKVEFPKDGDAGGTWIAMSKTLCVSLLNGNYDRDLSKTYRKSRGLVALEPFDFETIEAYLEQADFNGINGFTMVLIDLKSEIWELKWDGSELKTQRYDLNHPKLWVSVPDRFNHIRSWRNDAFTKVLEKDQHPDPDTIRSFHQIKSDPGGFGTQIVKNDMVYTVSMTQIIHNQKEPEISYYPY